MKIIFIDKVLRFAFTNTRQKVPGRYLQMAFLIFLLFAYYHLYYFMLLANNPTLYDAIGVSPQAPQHKVKSALRQVYRQHHPDRAGGKPSAEFVHFEKIGSVLSDPNKKWLYDRFDIDITWFDQYPCVKQSRSDPFEQVQDVPC